MSLSEVVSYRKPLVTLLFLHDMKFHVMHDFIHHRNGKDCGKFAILFPTLKLHKILHRIKRFQRYYREVIIIRF